MKYYVKLSERYNLKTPFVCSWTTELIGDGLREEFKAYLDNHKKEIGYKEGSSKILIIPVILQKFMNKKRISMVNDPVSGTIVSKFVLEKGKEKIVDERATKALDFYKEKRKQRKDGTFTDWEGFILIKAEKEEIDLKDFDVEVIGGDVDYFGETKVEEVPEVIGREINYNETIETPKPTFVCDFCGREVKNRIGLIAHKRSHGMPKKI